MKKIIILITSIFVFTHSYAQNEKTISTEGLGTDDKQILNFLKENPIWYQKTETETIRIEFIGFEKENLTTKPFNYGMKSKSSQSNPVIGLVFSKISDLFREKLFFGESGQVTITHLNTPGIIGSYNYVESEQKLYVNFENDKRVYTIENRKGKNLGFSGEDMPDIRLHNESYSEEFVADGNNDEGLYKKSNIYNWFYPENRYLFRYVISHKKPVVENGVITYKNVTDRKYAFATKIRITERHKPLNFLDDPYNIYLSDTNLLWKKAELEIVGEVNKNQKYEPNLFTSDFLNKLASFGHSKIYLCNDCPSTDPNTPFKSNKNKIKLYIDNALNNAGSGYKNSESELVENYYLTPNAGYSKRKLNDVIDGTSYIAYIDETGKHGFFWTKIIYGNQEDGTAINLTHEYAVNALKATAWRLPTIAEMQKIFNNKNSIFRKPDLAIEEIWTEEAYHGIVDFKTNGESIFSTYRLSDGVILQRPSNYSAYFIAVMPF